jgi:hypothetical protein
LKKLLDETMVAKVLYREIRLCLMGFLGSRVERIVGKAIHDRVENRLLGRSVFVSIGGVHAVGSSQGVS